jgi:hypothetical protein
MFTAGGSQGPPLFECRAGRNTSDFDPSVWTGRASQAGSEQMEGVGLAHLYPALAWSLCAPDHHAQASKLWSTTAELPTDKPLIVVVKKERKR